ncbi:MAG: amidase family protein [Acidimicrobiales bacterium]
MTIDFRNESLTELAGRVQSGDLSAQEVTQAALDRIAALNPSINAFVSVDGDRALADAADLDRRRADGDDIGPLAGIPIGVKDLEDAAGFRTTHGSRVHADDPIATTDSVLVERLKQSGCIVVGKTNTPEYGHKADTTNPLFGHTFNPWNTAISAGGSSGGSAAAVAAGMVPLCTASDGGGSIRIPSSVNGLTGFKPSLGRVPSGGKDAPTWGSLSTKGVAARRAIDVAAALDAVIGPDPSDLQSLPMPEQSWTAAVEDLHSPRRVVWSPTLGYAQVDKEVAELCASAVAKLEGAGTTVVLEESVFAEDPALPWINLAMIGSLAALRHLRDDGRWELLDPGHVALMEMCEANCTAADLVDAQSVAHQLNLRLVTLFHKAPLLLLPTLAGQPVAPGAEGIGTIDGEPDINWVRFTYPFNMTRSPAGTVPVGRTSAGVPVGLQVVGPQHGDAAVLRLLAVIENLVGFDELAPISP